MNNNPKDKGASVGVITEEDAAVFARLNNDFRRREKALMDGL